MNEAGVPPARWRGYIDEATHEAVSGWVQGGADPDRPVVLEISCNGVPVARVVADRYRADLKAAGIGGGRHGFTVRLPGNLPRDQRHVVHVRRQIDGGDIPRSPITLGAARSFDAAAHSSIVQAVAEVTTEAGAQAALAFLAAQTNRLLQRRATWADTPAGRRRALVVDETTPNPAFGAGAVAILSHMRALQQLGYQVSFIAAYDGAPDPVAVAALEATGIEHCGQPFHPSVEELLRRRAGAFDLVYLYRASSAAGYLGLARRYCPGARIVFSVCDLHHLRMARQATLEKDDTLLAKSRAMRRTELSAVRLADAVVTHSTAEADILRRAAPRVAIHVVPWATPLQPVSRPFGQRRGIAFIGGYNHLPNCDAATWLAAEIMPILRRADPSITCLLVGSDMPESVRRLAGDGIEAVGPVDDLASVFERVRATVAPLRYGAGIKGKVLSSLAAGVPCVMTPLAAEGIALTPILGALVGRDAAGIAGLLHRMHSDPAANRAAASAGLDLIGAGYSEAHVAAALELALAPAA
ncbi:glycosyl transferase family 4 [Stella humosa]|uniref:Glycosyl transferase family 4 n=1 Tax=Stella humosa TaxID=94 RepID=A0A3N1MCB1_9PROT|nr:glycosyltransferase [Stella humosa]ROQ01353.1 glycosyl transferase family 4 [Stella humosa]BBK31727.1 hypothetical protein STHU_23610 [Stella humosa]